MTNDCDEKKKIFLMKRSNIRIVFFGNTKYSVIDARILNDKFELTLIVTKPDKPSGRNRELIPNPVKKFAQEEKIQFLEADKLEYSITSKIKSFYPDFLIVADYGLILPNEVLEIPKYAPLNIHHSLLPKYRGPSPAASAILAGEKVSGVTIIKMTNEVDAGNILAKQKYQLTKDETTDSLLTKLNKIGAKLACKIINSFTEHSHQGATLVQGRTLVGALVGKPQDENLATFTKRFEKTDGYIDLKNPPSPQTLDRMIRAFHPWPGVYTDLRFKNKDLRIKLLPGGKIQPQGKNPITISEFLNGYPLAKEQIKKLHLI